MNELKPYEKKLPKNLKADENDLFISQGMKNQTMKYDLK